MTYVKNARHLVTVARGFEPAPEDTVKLLADALAHAVHQAQLSSEDAVGRLRDSVETIEAAALQSSACPACSGTGGFIGWLQNEDCDACGGRGRVSPAVADAAPEGGLSQQVADAKAFMDRQDPLVRNAMSGRFRYPKTGGRTDG